MGSGASADFNAMVLKASNEDIQAAFNSASPADRDKFMEALVSTTSEYTLTYWSACEEFLGRGWAPIMTLEEAGVKFKVLPFEPPEGNKLAACFAVPCVQTPSGAKVSQAAVVVTAIGKETGLWPKDFVSDVKATQFCVDSADLFSEATAGKPIDRIEKWYAHFESALSLTDGVFLFGNKVTGADFHVYSAIDRSKYKLKEAADESIKKYKALSAFMAKVEETKGYKASMERNKKKVDPWVFKYGP
jgi:hypothetical protein